MTNTILTLPLLGENAASREREVWLSQAREQRAELEQQIVELGRLEEELFQAHASVRPWDPAPNKAQLWELQELLPCATESVVQQMDVVVSLYGQVLQQDQDDATAHGELADLFWRLASWADERGMGALAEKLMALLAVHDDGRYADLIEGSGTIELDTDPPQARARIYPLEQIERCWVQGAPRELGRTPVGPVDVAPGRYVLEIRAKGYAAVRRPVLVQRGTHLQLLVRLSQVREVGPDFVHVPAGRFKMGGDARAAASDKTRHVFVDNFAIGRYPVTVGEYLLFLDDLATREPGRALRYTPHYGARSAADPRLPVTGVSFEAARAYCEWYSARTGVVHRLPTEEEWEKASRGVDGRAYPWGDFFDPSFCKMRDSRPGRALLEPVGSFDADHSVYGARDMAGSVAEWTDSFIDRARTMRVVRGGSWQGGKDDCRCAGRAAVRADEQLAYIGFRLVRPLAPGGGDAVSPPVVPSVEQPPQRRPRRRLSMDGARELLLSICRRLASQPPGESLRALVDEAVQLTGAERGFLITGGTASGPAVRCSRTAGASPPPNSDQRFDGEAVDAALRQRRTVELRGSRPLLVVPLVDGEHVLLLERRFSGSAFDDDERLIAAMAADLLGLALSLEARSAAAPGAAPSGVTLEQAVADVERELLRRALAAEAGNISRTARRLGLSRNGLRARLRRYALDPREGR